MPSFTYDDCANVAFVFGYTAPVGGDAPASVPTANVYSCTSVIKWEAPVGKDIALVRIDRAVTGRTPVPVRRVGKVQNTAPLLLLGHPDGMPLKLAGGAFIKQNNLADFFGTNADSFHGNSGGPVVNASTGLLEGVVSKGNNDYTVDQAAACLRVDTCSDTAGCTGGSSTYDMMARVASFQALVPDQAPRAFTTSSLTLDTSYARVASGDFDGDGRHDVLFQGADGAGDVLWYGNYDKTYTPVTVTVPDAYGVPLVGDFDGDKLSDIFWYRSGTGQDRIWWGAPRASFGKTASIRSMKEDGAGYSPFVGDFDGNGGADIFWYGRGASAPVWWFRTDTKGSYRSTTLTISGSYKPAIGDFNGDTAADILWYGTGTNADSRSWGRLL